MAYDDTIDIYLKSKAVLSYPKQEQEQFKALSDLDGRLIESVDHDQDGVSITFFDGVVLNLLDDAHYCCEARYMSTDDDAQLLVGRPLTGIEVRDGLDIEERYGCHDTKFLLISCDRGTVTFVNHNEHNGYYGGFDIRAIITR